MESISLQTNWPTFCKEVFSNENNIEILKNFKQRPEVTTMVETLSQENGYILSLYIKKLFPHLLKSAKMFKTSDEIGNPCTFDYQGWGKISPTTLRYIKILGELEYIFGNLNGYKIIEIGGGYGGQMKIIYDYFQPSNYVIFDLPEVLPLITYFANNYNIPNYQLKSGLTECNNDNCDLVMSNYAYSEMSKDTQQIYKSNIINNSKYGFFCVNFISNHFNIKSEELDDYFRYFKTAAALFDFPNYFIGGIPTMVVGNNTNNSTNEFCSKIRALRKEQAKFQFLLKMKYVKYSLPIKTLLTKTIFEKYIYK